MRRFVLAVLMTCSWSLYAQDECTATFNIDCERQVGSAGTIITNDCAAAKAFSQFCKRAGKSRRTQIYDLNEAAIAAMSDAPRKAGTLLRRADRLANRPEDLSCRAVIVNNLGIARYLRGHFDLAIEAFTRAARYSDQARQFTPLPRPPDYAQFTPAQGAYTCFGQPLAKEEILTNRGLAHVRSGHLREAEQDYDAAAANGSSERKLDLLDMIASAALNKPDSDGALRIAGKMHRASTSPARVRRSRNIEGAAHFLAGRLPEAVTAYEAAVTARAPSDGVQGNIHLELGELYMQLHPGRAGLAVEQFEKAAPLITRQDLKDRLEFGQGAALIHRGVETKTADDIRRGMEKLARFAAAHDARSDRDDLARSHRAYGHYELGDFASAAPAYEELIPQSKSFVTLAAYSHLRAGSWQKAIDIASNALSSTSGSEKERLQWMELRGYAHDRLGHSAEARADLEKVAAARFPNANKARAIDVFLASSYASEKRWDKARAFLEPVLATPFSASEQELEVVAQKSAAAIYGNQEPPDFPKALAAHERLVILLPNDPGQRRTRAAAYLRAGDKPRATSLYKELIAAGIEPSAPGYILLASEAFCAEDLDKAEELYGKAVSDPELKAIADRGIADVLYVRGRRIQPLASNPHLDAADAKYASLQETDEATRKHIAAMRGHIAYIRRDWKTALDFYNDADAADPKIQELIRAATKGTEVEELKILPLRPEELGPDC